MPAPPLPHPRDPHRPRTRTPMPRTRTLARAPRSRPPPPTPPTPGSRPPRRAPAPPGAPARPAGPPQRPALAARRAYRKQRRTATLTALGYFVLFLTLSAFAPSFMTGTVTGVPASPAARRGPGARHLARRRPVRDDRAPPPGPAGRADPPSGRRRRTAGGGPVTEQFGDTARTMSLVGFTAVATITLLLCVLTGPDRDDLDEFYTGYGSPPPAQRPRHRGRRLHLRGDRARHRRCHRPVRLRRRRPRPQHRPVPDAADVPAGRTPAQRLPVHHGRRADPPHAGRPRGAHHRRRRHPRLAAAADAGPTRGHRTADGVHPGLLRRVVADRVHRRRGRADDRLRGDRRHEGHPPSSRS